MSYVDSFLDDEFLAASELWTEPVPGSGSKSQQYCHESCANRLWFHIYEYIEFNAKFSKSYIQLKTFMLALCLYAERHHI
jgi:hypothetical protein